MFGLDFSSILKNIGPIAGAIAGLAGLFQSFRKPKAQAGQATFAPPPQVTAPPPSQAAAAPDENLRRQNIQALLPKTQDNQISTLLTGPGGVANDKLRTGKATLLGG